MELVLHAIDKGGDHVIRHDLNFQKTEYASVHPVVGSFGVLLGGAVVVTGGLDFQQSSPEPS